MTDEAPELRDEPAPEGETPETRPRGPAPDSIGIDPIAAGRGRRLADRLDRPLFRLLDPPPDAMAPGDRLGPYRILRPLGRGGSGCVYLAEQCAGGLRRRVAVKVLSPGVNAREVLERFRTEGRILARLRHAHIATLYDAGITPAGRPYFALEWVEGSPIDRYCRERALPLRDRLAIFLQVCSAVRYAHQNLVIHRDLKPGNILVDGRGEPRLLDFGIAKLLGGERAGGPGTTHPWVRPMTPEYASPEQILGEPVTTVSDVYCLGVLLFELLAGEHPHAAVERSPYALQRRICEEDPERPSAVAGRRHRAGSEGARSRGPGARRARQLRGELDAIVLTAMARRPEDRYGSVSELADDVRRYLEGYPVRARRPGAIVRGVKLLRRHLREAVAAALVLLTVGGALLLRAHERARRFEEREHTVRVAELLFDLLETADLQTARDRPVTVRALLDEAAERLETELPHDPRLRATMHELLGRSFRNLGAYGRAAPFLEAAYAERSARLGPDHPETVEALSELASLEVRRGRFARAESLYRRALQHRAARFGDDDSGTVGLREALAMVLVDQDRFAEAEPLLRRVLTARTGGGPASQPARLAATRSNLAFLLHRTGEHAEAIPLLRAALTTSRRSLGDDHPQVSALRINLAAALRARGRLGEAERLIRSTLAVWERELGPDHPSVASAWNSLGAVSWDRGDLDVAEQAFRRAGAIWSPALGDDHPSVLAAQSNLARVLLARGRHPEAETILRGVLAARPADPEDGKSIPPGPWGSANNTLALVLAAQGRLEEAEERARRGLEIRRSRSGHPAGAIGESLVTLASVLLSGGRPGEAEAPAREGHRLLLRDLPPTHWKPAWAKGVLGAVLGALGRRGEAEELLASGAGTLATVRGPDDPLTRGAAAHLAALARTGDPEVVAPGRRPDRLSPPPTP